MEKIKITEEWKDFELCFEDNIKTKHMRKMYPFISKMSWDEIEASLEIAEILFINIDWNIDLENYKKFIDELSLSNMTKVLESIWEIITDASKKK